MQLDFSDVLITDTAGYEVRTLARQEIANGKLHYIRSAPCRYRPLTPRNQISLLFDLPPTLHALSFFTL